MSLGFRVHRVLLRVSCVLPLIPKDTSAVVVRFGDASMEFTIGALVITSTILRAPKPYSNY